MKFQIEIENLDDRVGNGFVINDALYRIIGQLQGQSTYGVMEKPFWFTVLDGRGQQIKVTWQMVLE